MGSWGIQPFDCDEGLDIKDRWNDWIGGFNNVGYEEAIKRFFERWGGALKHGDSITNNEVIALAALHLETNRNLPKKLLKATEDAINRELEPEVLTHWVEDAQGSREKFLVELLNRIGGERKKPKKVRYFSDPALNYRSLDVARRELLKAFLKSRKSKIPISLKDVGFPYFMETLSRFMKYGVWEKDMTTLLQARAERAMMLATYLALVARYSEDELENMLKDIQKRMDPS